MLQTRVIPTLLLKDEVLVKTIKFKNPNYIGDPINTCRIFNELEADELSFIDIRSSLNNKPPNFKILREISSECFMPLSYGGGINTLQQIESHLLSRHYDGLMQSGTLKGRTGMPVSGITG